MQLICNPNDEEVPLEFAWVLWRCVELRIYGMEGNWIPGFQPPIETWDISYDFPK